jgi:hypothetical protein
MSAHKVSLFSVVGLGVLALAQVAQASSLIRCSSQVIGGASIEIDSSSGTGTITGDIDGIRFAPGAVKAVPARSSGVQSFEFDTGTVIYKTSGGNLKSTRIQGRLDVNSADTDRSMMHSTKLERVCGGINFFGHCSGGYDVLKADAQPVAYEMSCHLSK